MKYWSRLGTICYYDFSDYRPYLREPSVLFLLGLESVLTPSSEYIDTVPVIDKNTKEQAIDPETGELLFEDKPNKERLKTCILHRDEIGEDEFDKAYFYLYGKQPKDDVTEIHVTFKNFKMYLNTITGVSSDRIVPIICHDCFNHLSIDDFNVEAQKLIDILNCAGYNVKANSVPYRGKFGVTDPDELAAIDLYNNNLKEIHEKKKLYSQLYKTLDYKSMYSYALGVLYGCQCLGYSDVFSNDPLLWYNGEYTNLVKTAYITFKFHADHHICDIDGDKRLYNKYKGTQLNRIWNFN